MEQRFRILIADDHPLFRGGIRTLLETLPDVEVIGEATTGVETVSMVQVHQPDIVLMDLKMPEMSGIEATRRILEIQPQTRILMITMFEDDPSVFTAMRAGARGYILKDAERDDIVRAIRAVGRGEAIFSPSIAARLMDFFTTATSTVPREAFPMLTTREREILHLMTQSTSNAEIADLLSLSGKTVANYVSNILGKLQVADRDAAIRQARDMGMGSPGTPETG
jgi:DNA-binding NarL/FixJ family response regulator